MAIYTSSWFTPLPPEVQRIGISRGTPRNMKAGFRVYRELAPGNYFKSATIYNYRDQYMAGLLAMDPIAVRDRILGLQGDAEHCALLCYEHPQKEDDWCHRGYVAAWLFDNLKEVVCEWGMEQAGHGWQHPKIPKQFRTFEVAEPINVTPYIGATVEHNDETWTVLDRSETYPDQAIISK